MANGSRGGRRSGTPGVAHGNRTDLNANSGAPTPPPPAPSHAVASPNPQPGYGEATPAPPMPHPSGGFQSPGPNAGYSHPDDTLTLTAPTQYPEEPITAGLPTGPGPGPEALTPSTPAVTQWTTGRDMAAMLAASPSASPTLKTLFASLNGGF